MTRPNRPGRAPRKLARLPVPDGHGFTMMNRDADEIVLVQTAEGETLEQIVVKRVEGSHTNPVVTLQLDATSVVMRCGDIIDLDVDGQTIVCQLRPPRRRCAQLAFVFPETLQVNRLEYVLRRINLERHGAHAKGAA